MQFVPWNSIVLYIFNFALGNFNDAGLDTSVSDMAHTKSHLKRKWQKKTMIVLSTFILF